MANYYVINGTASIPDGGGSYTLVTGSNANDGLTSLTPKKDLSNWISTYTNLNSGDVLNIAGDHVGQFDLTNCAGTIQQWANQTQARIRGSHEPIGEGGAWALSSGTTYRISIGTGKSVSNVCANWLASQDSDGRRGGWYAVGTLSTGALTADKRYFYDSAAGFLYFRNDAIGDPSSLSGDNRVMWQDSTLKIGLTVRGTGAAVVDGLWFMHYNTGLGVSYGVLIGGTGQTVQNCTAYDCEVHSFTATFTTNVNNKFINCVAYGAGSTTDATLFVTHCSTADATGDVTGSVCLNCRAYPYSLLDSTMTPLTAGLSIAGFYGHTAGAGGTVDSWICRGCYVKGNGELGNGFNCGNSNTTVSNTDAASEYPIQCYDCQVVNVRQQVLDTNIAFVRCFFETTLCAGLTTTPIFADFASAATSGTTRVLLDSCVLVGNTNDTTLSGRKFFYIGTGSQITLLNSTVIDLGDNNAYPHTMFQFQSGDNAFAAGSAGFKLKSRGSIYYFNNAGSANHYFAYFDNLGPDSNYDMDGDWVFQTSGNNFWAQNASRKGTTYWQANIGKNSVISTNPSFTTPTSTSPTVAGSPSLTSPLWTTKYRTTLHTTQGYNRKSYGGQRGAYQRGSSASKLLAFEKKRFK